MTSSISSSSSNEINLNSAITLKQQGFGGLQIISNNGANLDYITPPTSALSDNNNNNSKSKQTVNNSNSQSNSINLTQNFLNQLNAANINLADTAPSPSRL